MNAYAVSMAMSANAMAGQAGASQSGGASPDISFVSLLNSALNSGGTSSGDGSESFTTLSNGIRWQDVKIGMLMEAVSEAGQNEQPATGDTLLAQLLNMLKDLMVEGGEGQGGDILQLVKQMMDRLKQIAEENGGQMAAQELMNMMNAMGQTVPASLTDTTVLMTGTGLEEAAATTMPQLDGAEVLQTVLGGTAEDLLKLLTGAQTGAQTQPLSAEASGEQTGFTAALEATTVATEAGPGLGDEDQAQQMDAQTGTGGEQTAKQTQTTQSFSNLRQAYDAWAQSKSQSVKTSSEKPLDVDIDALQQRVDAGVYLRNTAMAEAPVVETTGEAMAQTPLASQLSEGIQTAVANGNEQFTIKLNPEELGEVTIRLTKTAEGNMTLDIVARNAETQRLLAGEVDALKETLKPLKVEVENILTERQDTMLQNQQNQSGNRQNWQPMHGAAYYGDEPLGQTAETGAVAAAVASAAPHSVLDTYI